MQRTMLLLVGLITVFTLKAQQDFHFENFTTADGLSSNNIRSILRDRTGFLWVGTANGLNRFDGYTFKAFLPEYNNPNSLSGPAISTLAEDSQGRIWIAHNRGIAVYDPARDTFIALSLPDLAQELEQNFTHGCKLLIDQQDKVWIVNEGLHVWCWHDQTKKMDRLTPPDVPIDHRPTAGQRATQNIIFGITRKSDNEAWVNTIYGIFTLDLIKGTFQHFPLPDYEGIHQPGFIFQDDVRHWGWFMGFSQDFYSFDYHTGKTKAWGIQPSQALVSGLQVAAIDRDHIWFSSPGILNIRTNVFQPIQHIPDDSYSFPDGVTNTAYLDQDSILWIGTTKGLAKLDPRLQSFQHVQVSSHPKDQYDTSIIEIYQPPGSQQVYITSFYHDHLYTYDFQAGTSSIIPSIPERSLSATTRIFKDSYGITWLLAKSLVYQVDFEKESFRPILLPPLPAGVSDRVITDVAEDANGNLWFAKWRAGLFLFDRKTEQLHYIAEKEQALSTRVPFFIVSSIDKTRVWIATQGDGIFEYNLTNKKTIHFDTLVTAQESFVADNATGLQVDLEDNLWIATNQGLARRDTEGDIRIFGIRNGFASDYFEGIGKDLKGRLWLSTPIGLSSIDPETFFIRNFDERHGIKIEGSPRHFSVSPDGELFVGVNQGFIRFHPDSIVIDQRPPKVVFTSFKVNGQEFKSGGLFADYVDNIQLGPTENFFSIEFAALNFTLPEENAYFYQLEGLEQDWKEAGKNRMATYTNLAPGNYRFRVKAKNSDQVWSAVEKNLTIVIKPPYWQTWWFILLIALITGGIIFTAYRFRVGQIKQAEQMKAAFDKRLAEVEMQALRSQMNPHFLFNCLNSINRFIQCNEPDAASAYLTKFSRLVRLVLDNSRTNMVTLRDELEALRLYLELESMRFVGRFKYRLEVSHELDKTSVEVPPMIIQPYVENAIWHGLMHKESNDCQLSLRVYPNGDDLIVEVEDNGIGREAAQQLKSKSATLHKSHGMKVTAERIDVINELYQTNVSVVIEDLKDNDGLAVGTKVILSLPL